MGDYKANQIIMIREKFKNEFKDKEADYLNTLNLEEKQMYLKALPISWLPIEMNASMTAKAMPFLYSGSLNESFFEFGETLAREDLSGIYRIMVRISTVPFLLDQTAKLWKLYHRQGKMLMQKEQRQAELVIADYPDFPEPNHQVMIGYIFGAVSLTGAKNIVVKGERVDLTTIKYKISWN